MDSAGAVPEFSVDELVLIVSRVTEWPNDQIEVQDHSVEPFSSTVDGFLAEHYALRVSVRWQGFSPDQSDRKLSFFVKALPRQNPCLVEYLESIGTFRKEITLFEEVLPRIHEAVGGKNFAPRMVFAKANRLIVLENLKTKGYDIVAANNGLLDGFQLRKAMDALVRLHAGSLIIEKIEGKTLLELYPGVLEENAWVECESSVRRKDVENVINFWCEIVKLSEKNPKRLAIILKDLPRVIRKIFEFVKPSSQFRNVLSHGDLWKNNLMYRSLAGIPEDCVLVDFQMARYVPPAYDLNLVIYLSTSRIFRKQHYDALVMDYHTHLQKLLATHEIGLDSELFRESCKLYKSAGLIHTCLISPEVLLPQSYLQKVMSESDSSCGFMPNSKVTICLKAFQADPPYRSRLLDMLDELIDTEILPQ
ncbi:AAEL006607-PA [Aedes aegypti]|uniref:AAEL006607-PA n=2 Tax=Aedes aegypti TaxID=7159 RepID=A0A1S4FE61_AEDAE|nr:uncharacterized protein LOC5568173 [Aedes aegypti]EAT41772.1 AAEL006607-PA [Aedes aegypti]